MNFEGRCGVTISDRVATWAPPPAMLIGGQWVAATSGGTFTTEDPARGGVVGTAPNGSGADARLAVDAAYSALPHWAARPAAERGRILRAVGDALLERQAELARLITSEEGKPLREARNEVGFSADLAFWFAEEGRRAYGQWIPAPDADRRMFTVRQPVGVVAAITPWNVPASMIVRKVAPALAAGCTLVVKPAEQTALTGLAIGKIFQDAGVPDGVVNVVTGDAVSIGQAWLHDDRVRKLCFTGSTETGRLLMRGAAEHVQRVSLELGGNAPYIVFDDADLDTVMRHLVAAKFRNGGQTCVSTNRIYVQRGLVDEVARRLVALVEDLRVGDGADPDSDVGPLVDRAAIEKIERRLAAAVRGGARVLTGGGRLTGGEYVNGCFFAPTVLTDVADDMEIVREETFGPVAPVIAFDDEAEVVAAANATPYGLAAYVFTRDLNRAVRMAERLDVGMVGINDQRVSAAEAPFGGVKSSGIGREGGHEGITEFLETKLIVLGMEK